MKGIRLVVKKNYLKYRIPGFKEGQSFVPKIGDMIVLPKETAFIELESGNVRKLLSEEREALAKKAAAKKTTTVRKKKAA